MLILLVFRLVSQRMKNEYLLKLMQDFLSKNIFIQYIIELNLCFQCIFLPVPMHNLDYYNC